MIQGGMRFLDRLTVQASLISVKFKFENPQDKVLAVLQLCLFKRLPLTVRYGAWRTTFKLQTLCVQCTPYSSRFEHN